MGGGKAGGDEVGEMRCMPELEEINGRNEALASIGGDEAADQADASIGGHEAGGTRLKAQD